MYMPSELLEAVACPGKVSKEAEAEGKEELT